MSHTTHATLDNFLLDSFGQLLFLQIYTYSLPSAPGTPPSSTL